MKKMLRFVILMIILAFTIAACGKTGGSAADLRSNSWLLTSLNGTPVVSGSTVTLTFDKKSLGGSGGCNSYGGDYTLRGTKLSMENIYSTEMYCEASGVMDQEAQYFELLSKAESFSISGDVLTLSTSSGDTLVFEKTTF